MRRGLAGAVGAEEAVHLPRAHREVEPVEGPDVPNVLTSAAAPRSTRSPLRAHATTLDSDFHDIS